MDAKYVDVKKLQNVAKGTKVAFKMKERSILYIPVVVQ